MKPENFLIGGPKKTTTVFLIDFGLTKHYVNEITEEHIPYKEGKKLVGTARFVSIRTHQGCEQSRRDDLEGICYIMLYFLRKSLPWQGIIAKAREFKHEIIKELKLKNTAEILCKGLPSEVEEMLVYSRNLKFDEKPNYEYLYKLIGKMLKDRGEICDHKYNWIDERSIYYNCAEARTTNETNIEDLNQMLVDTPEQEEDAEARYNKYKKMHNKEKTKEKAR